MSSLDSAKAAVAKLDKRTKIMIGGLALVVVAGGGYLALGSSSSSSSTAISVPIHHVTPTPAASAKPSASPAPSNLPAQSNPERDPFAPLPAESAAAAATGSTATVAAATTTTSTASTAATSTSPITVPTPTPTPSASHTIELISITGTSADVTYNGTDKTVTAGQTLSTGITCIKISADSIFVSNGSKAYAIAPGQTISF